MNHNNAIVLGFVVCIAAGSTMAGATPPHVYVDEKFGGSQFPPTGWVSDGSWINAGGYAYGSAVVTHVPSVITSEIRTYTLHLNASNRLRIRFRYLSTSWGAPCEHQVTILGPGYSFSRHIPIISVWSQFDWDYGAVSYTGDYKIEWGFIILGYNYTGGATLGIDDILVTESNTTIEPASLGRAKAAFL